jgi:hypothetical protein
VPPKTGKSSAEGIRCDCCCCWRDCRCVCCRWPGVEGVDKDGRPPRVFGEEEYGFGRPPARGAPSPFSCPSTWQDNNNEYLESSNSQKRTSFTDKSAILSSSVGPSIVGLLLPFPTRPKEPGYPPRGEAGETGTLPSAGIICGKRH